MTVIIDPGIDPITIEGGSPSSVHFTTVVEVTQTGTTMAITKATASADEVAATSRAAATESMSLDSVDEVATVQSTMTGTVTVALARSTETLPLLTTSA